MLDINPIHVITDTIDNIGGTRGKHYLPTISLPLDQLKSRKYPSRKKGQNIRTNSPPPKNALAKSQSPRRERNKLKNKNRKYFPDSRKSQFDLKSSPTKNALCERLKPKKKITEIQTEYFRQQRVAENGSYQVTSITHSTHVKDAPKLEWVYGRTFDTCLGQLVSGHIELSW